MGTELKLKKRGLRKCLVFLGLAVVMALNLPTAMAAQEIKYLIPMGNTVGISLETDGVMVVGFTEMQAGEDNVSPARSAGLVAGDIITKIGSKSITCADDLKAAVSGMDGSPISVRVCRGGEVLQMTLTPQKNEKSDYELGMWLRDGVSGIGTLTFYDPDTGVFGALGHPVSDVDTGILVPLKEGSVMRSTVSAVIPGQCGAPGQLIGAFDLGSVLGSLTTNTSNGLFGIMSENNMTQCRTPLPAASDSEIHTGDATILSNISGDTVAEYEIEITRIYTGNDNSRSMMIKVTDEKLLGITGGIVQGMSGSPIIQNDKLVGAVTHVLINDPSKGYAVSIGRMLETVYGKSENRAA